MWVTVMLSSIVGVHQTLSRVHGCFIMAKLHTCRDQTIGPLLSDKVREIRMFCLSSVAPLPVFSFMEGKDREGKRKV